MRRDKNKAISLRLKGYSYNDISRQLAIPKSTLSSWFRDLVLSKEIKTRNIDKKKKSWSRNITAYNKRRSELARENWQRIQDERMLDIGLLTERELLLVGVALYWAEGFKKTNWHAIFSNSDPAMIKLMTHFFLHVCKTPRDKLKLQIQLHERNVETEAIAYWSATTGLPKSQFNKSTFSLSIRSKKKRGNTLPFGTLRIRMNDVRLVNALKGWIEGLARSCSAGKTV